MNSVLQHWNQAAKTTAMETMLSCCASRRWAEEMVARRPVATVEALAAIANEVWSAMEEQDWLEAFSAHPRIGQRIDAGSREANWSRQEQSSINSASDRIRSTLAEANAEYEVMYGFTYIVCATGKSAEEMLAILRRRLGGGREEELRESAEQQRQIMQIRLRKWVTA